MPTDHQEQWPEHAVCARCAAPLGDDFQESPLGLRFCKDCFDGTIQEKVRERAAVIYIKGKCSKCGKSLINGYRLNQFGVLYCLACSDVPAQKPPEPDAEEESSETPRESGIETQAVVVLLLLLATAHLIYFADYLLSGRILNGTTFFRPLVSLDLLTLVLLVVSRRLSPSLFTLIWSLLLCLSFFILIVRGLAALV